jgi:hypothetical protein
MKEEAAQQAADYSIKFYFTTNFTSNTLSPPGLASRVHHPEFAHCSAGTEETNSNYYFVNFYLYF